MPWLHFHRKEVKAMVDQQTLMKSVKKFLRCKDYYNIITLNDILVCKDKDCIVVCRVKYTTDEYEQAPTREECEKIMCSVLKDLNLDEIGSIRFDEIQVLDLENGKALIRHHINACND